MSPRNGAPVPHAVQPTHNSEYDDAAERQRDLLRDQKRMVVEAEQKASDLLTQVSLIGGPAAILASVTYIKDIAPTPTPGTALLLILAWLTFLVGAGCALGSLTATRQAARKYEHLLDDKIDSEDPWVYAGDYKDLRPINRQSERFSRAAIYTFLAGIVMLTAFAAINLPFWREPIPQQPLTPQAVSTSAVPAVTGDALGAMVEACKLGPCEIVYRRGESSGK